VGKVGLEPEPWGEEDLILELREPTDKRIYAVAEALRRGHTVEKIAALTAWTPFFIEKMANLVAMEGRLKAGPLTPDLVNDAKRLGYGDEYIGVLAGVPEHTIRVMRRRATYKMVDTCGGEFEARTPYYYSTYESGDEVVPLQGKKVLIVGSGPIRIAQGVEFDYCTVAGILALREAGIGAIIVNNNPETVSTDFDVSDRLYFDPLLLEDVLNVIEAEKPFGVILQFGGQTSVNLAIPLQEAIERDGLETRILGTPPVSIDIAEDRRKFEALMRNLGIAQPAAATGFSFEEVRGIAAEIGYPVLVRPSYVLGGRAMQIVHAEEELAEYMAFAVKVSRKHPVLVDKYLSHAIEIDVDAIADGRDVFIGGIQEHIEEAGVHSGDAACVLPTQTLPPEVLQAIRDITHKVCRELRVVGLVNLQLAVKDGTVYILEANPRASRTVPYVSKAIGVPLAKVATRVMLGETLADMGLVGESKIPHVAVKAPVFPFQKLPGVD
ncbi:MAG: carbamoyl-phosphate synthase large subunit, partial [Candidatus Thermoplasmatota archaeon]